MRITVRGNQASIFGVETGPLTVVKRAGTTLVLKESGHKYWVQHGPGDTHAYAPARFRVFQVDENEPLDGSMHAIEIIDFPVRG